jgi:hypothetical protein
MWCNESTFEQQDWKEVPALMGHQPPVLSGTLSSAATSSVVKGGSDSAPALRRMSARLAERSRSVGSPTWGRNTVLPLPHPPHTDRRGLCPAGDGGNFPSPHRLFARNLPGPGRLLTLRRRVLPHVDHILGTVINVPLACFQGGGVRLADHCLGEAPLTLINHEVSPGPLLAPENLALQHAFSIPLYADAPFGLGIQGQR